MPISKPTASFSIPTTSKSSAQPSDHFIGIDDNNEPYTITKSNLLAGLSGGTGGATPTGNTLLLINGSQNIADATGKSVTNNNVVLSGNQKYFGNNSLLFNGENSSLIIPSSGINILSGDFTVECLYYPLNMAGWRPLICQWKQVNEQGHFVLGTENGTVRFWFGAASESNAILSWVNMEIHKWFHVAISRRGSQFFLYVNGEQKAEVTTSVTRPASNIPITIGNYLNPEGNIGANSATSLSGYLQEIRITDFAAYKPPSQQPIAPFTL